MFFCVQQIKQDTRLSWRVPQLPFGLRLHIHILSVFFSLVACCRAVLCRPQCQLLPDPWYDGEWLFAQHPGPTVWRCEFCVVTLAWCHKNATKIPNQPKNGVFPPKIFFSLQSLKFEILKQMKLTHSRFFCFVFFYEKKSQAGFFFPGFKHCWSISLNFGPGMFQY